MGTPSHDEWIAGILRRWEEMIRQGQTPDLQELCAQHPELLEMVRLRIAAHPPLAASSSAQGEWTTEPNSDLVIDPIRLLGPPQSADELGILGRYRIKRLLGRGGMGVVFLADDPKLQRSVAIKVLLASAGNKQKATERFLREARASAALHSDHIVPVFEVDEANGYPFLVMPYLEGQTLQQRLKQVGRLSVQESIIIAIGIARGLLVAHRAGILHRDIKPGNIWLESPEIRAKILDFGLARAMGSEMPMEALTLTGAILGTPSYMSPEQSRSLELDGRSDLFSLGAVLYEMTTGQRPFTGKSITAVLTALAMDEPSAPRLLNPAIPPALEQLIQKLLAKKPEDRPADAEQVIAELQSILLDAADVDATRSLQLPPAMTPSPTPPTPPTRRHPIQPVLVAVLAILLLGAAGVRWAWRHRPQSEPETVISREPFRGSIDVRISSPDDPLRRDLTLNRPGALPITSGDVVRIEVELNRPGYPYIVWIDSRGEAQPVYPWKPGDWKVLAEREVPVKQLNLPRDQTQGWPMNPDDPPGMETLILLVRDEPLPADFDCARAFQGMPRMVAQTRQSAAWFENAQLVTAEREPTRAPRFDALRPQDPLVQLQKTVQDRCGAHFPLIRAVSFSYDPVKP